MSGILSPVFLQAAGRAGKNKNNKIILTTVNGDSTIDSLSGTGEIRVESIKNGTKQIATYSNPSSLAVSVSADKGTTVTLFGDVTSISASRNTEFDKVVINSTALTSVSFTRMYEMRSLDIINAPSLATLDIGNSTEIVRANIAGAKNVTSVNCGNCFSLSELIFGEHPSLVSLTINYTELVSVVIPENTPLQTISGIYAADLQVLEIKDRSLLSTVTLTDCHRLSRLVLNGAANLLTINVKNAWGLEELLLEDTVALTTVNCSECYSLKHLDVNHADQLTSLDATNSYILSNLEVSGCSSLQTLKIRSVEELSTLDIRDTVLTTVDFAGCIRIDNIYCHATNSSVATAIAGLITANAVLAGTVYVNSADTYYSTIETAANNAGWTIAPLPA